jgi:hypothetical protein
VERDDRAFTKNATTTSATRCSPSSRVIDGVANVASASDPVAP